MAMKEKARIHNKKRIKYHNYWEVMKIIREATAYWKEMGFVSLIRDFKEEVQDL